MQSPILGIDLGTTHSLCAVFESGAPRLIANAHGRWLTPSVVGVLPDGSTVVGEAARELAVTQPERTVAHFKRWMGEDRKVELAGRSWQAPELSALVLRSLVADAEADLGVPIREAVITVPAYFNENQRRATRLAGELAGLEVRRILNEPSAAALAYGLHNAGQIENLLVFDLGGGTFDVTVMEIFEGTLEIRSTAGESHLGGEDFTDRIVQWALGEQGLQLEYAEMREPMRVARLRHEAERAKRALSEHPLAELRLPDAHGEINPEAQALELHREQFIALCRPLLDRLQRPVMRALGDSDLAWKDVQTLLLVGGATRMPILRELLQDWSGQVPQHRLDPDQVVALGAAVQAALIADDHAVREIVMTDVCPFTLGVEISKDFGLRRMDGYFLPVIHRNTTIPVSREETVYTVHEGQNEVLVNIYQGEGRKVADNLKIGELRVTGIPGNEKNQAVTLRFTYDINGLLEVEAIIEATGKRFQVLVEHNVQGLSAKEIQAAHERMQAVKFYPRDDLENQRLLQFGEKILKELHATRREQLGEILDYYEMALHSGNREVFDAARERLLLILSSLGFPHSED
ncbi:MAG: Hsp70 family protein [Planctomycetota bacterium]